MDNVAYCDRLCFRIEHSTLTKNSAMIGGAIRIVASLSEVVGCLFAHNSARMSGGALSFETGASHATIDRTSFIQNRAKIGGACSLSVGATVTFDSDLDIVTFARNVAQYGGALSCFGCGNMHFKKPILCKACVDSGLLVHGTIRFEENVALNMGGGMYASGATIEKGSFCANFTGNVALFGAGLALEDCLSFQLGVASYSFTPKFLNNIAHRGGGLYLNAGNDRLEYYQVFLALKLHKLHGCHCHDR